MEPLTVDEFLNVILNRVDLLYSAQILDNELYNIIMNKDKDQLKEYLIKSNMKDELRNVDIQDDNNLKNESLIDRNFRDGLASPQLFIKHQLLKIEIEINYIPSIAFIDTGAEYSTITETNSARCNMWHMINRRIQYDVVGVGNGRAVGSLDDILIKLNGKQYLIDFLGIFIYFNSIRR